MRASLTVTLLAATGCATTQGRSYERDELATLPLRSITMYVDSASPVEAGPQLFVDTLAPVDGESALAPPTSNAAMRDALSDAVRAQFEAKGYAVTATRASTVEALRASSEADLILVVRVQPVDRFFVSTWSPTEREIARKSVSTARPPMSARVGRLLIGQAYVFDRRTGLRLWSRDALDLPDGGWLHPDSALLAYGVLGARPPDRLATEAAATFTKATFADFPDARAGRAAARASLDAVDVERDAVMLARLDRTRWTFGVDTGWSYDRLGARIEGVGDGVSIGTRAIAPAGTFRLTPRFDVRFPGGVTMGVGVSLGVAPGSFAKSYVRADRGTSIAFSSPEHLGLQIRAGYDVFLTPTLHVRPGVGFLIEGWRLGATPDNVVEGDVVSRFGAVMEGAVIYDLTDTFSVVGGVRGRAGAIPRDGLSVGIEGFVGIGIGG